MRQAIGDAAVLGRAALSEAGVLLSGGCADRRVAHLRAGFGRRGSGRPVAALDVADCLRGDRRGRGAGLGGGDGRGRGGSLTGRTFDAVDVLESMDAAIKEIPGQRTVVGGFSGADIADLVANRLCSFADAALVAILAPRSLPVAGLAAIALCAAHVNAAAEMTVMMMVVLAMLLLVSFVF